MILVRQSTFDDNNYPLNIFVYEKSKLMMHTVIILYTLTDVLLDNLGTEQRSTRNKLPSDKNDEILVKTSK